MSDPIRQDVLKEAISIITQDRNTDYDSPENNFDVIAQLWSAYLEVPVLPHDVAVLNVLQKVSRIKTSPEKRDHWVDIAGYAACGAECVSAYGNALADIRSHPSWANS